MSGFQEFLLAALLVADGSAVEVRDRLLGPGLPDNSLPWYYRLRLLLLGPPYRELRALVRAGKLTTYQVPRPGFPPGGAFSQKTIFATVGHKE